MTAASTYTVEGIHCDHCREAISREVAKVPGVSSVEVDLTSKLVAVHGTDVNDSVVRQAIREAGYEPAA